MCDPAMDGEYALEGTHNGKPKWVRKQPSGVDIVVYWSERPSPRWLIDRDLDVESYFAYANAGGTAPPRTGWREYCDGKLENAPQLDVSLADLDSAGCTAVVADVLAVGKA